MVTCRRSLTRQGHPGGGRDCREGDNPGAREHAGSPARRCDYRDVLAWRSEDLLQLESRIADVAQALLRIFFETSLKQAAECRRRAGGKECPVRSALEDCCDGVGKRVALKRQTSSQHFKTDTAKRPDVGPFVDRFSASLLRAHVAGRADHHALNRGGASDRMSEIDAGSFAIDDFG